MAAGGSHAGERVSVSAMHEEARAALELSGHGHRAIGERGSAFVEADEADDRRAIGDRFVPVSLEALVAALAEEAQRAGHDALAFERVCEMLRAVIEQEADALRRLLNDLYDPMNPDRDVVDEPSRPGGKDPAGTRRRLEIAVRYVLEKANYRRLEPVDLDGVVRAASTRGLRVRLRSEMVEEVDLWIRGMGVQRRRMRTRRAPVRGELVDVPVYRRLVVIARLSGDPSLYLKVYRTIPIADLEALLPHASAAMSVLDKAKIIGGASLALGSIGGALAAAPKGIIALLMALAVPFGVIAWRAFTGYRLARAERDRQLTRNLFYMNLASNAAVLHTLVARSAEEEAKEAVLAYAAGLIAGGEAGLPSRRAVDRWCESWLNDRFGISIDFDAPDAIETIDRIGLWIDRRRFRVEPLARAFDIADRHWTQKRSWDYHAREIARREREPSEAGGERSG